MIVLGARYKDRISGFEGTATGDVTYLSGCNQALISPKVGADGAARDPQWFDHQRLERVGQDVVKLENSNTPGPDRPAPIR